MWKLSKHLKLSRAHSELESLLLERTAALQNLSHRLLIVQDEERRKIARELHDNTGQTLAALRMAISCLQESCKPNSATLALASDVAQLADQAQDEFERCRTCCIPHCWMRWDFLARRSGISRGSPNGAELTSKQKLRIRINECRNGWRSRYFGY